MLKVLERGSYAALTSAWMATSLATQALTPASTGWV
jgi:hypothetical protein